ncbi:MAG: T9SS type A sorting domain-containing protein [Cryomorphaceae bacterium]
MATPPNVTHTNFSSVCDGDDPFLLTGGTPAGGSYSGSGVVGGDTFDPSIATIGNNVIWYTYVDGNGCADSVSKTINVGQSPAIFTTSITACESDGPINLATASYGFPTGGTHTGTGVSGTQFYPSIAGPGTHYIYYASTNGCYASDSITAVVTAAPNANLTAPSTACATSSTPIVLVGTPSGGTFTWNSINSQLFYPSLAGIGNVMVTYSVTQSGCTAVDTEYVYVDTVPTVAISTFPTLCEGDDTLNLVPYGTPSGGTFSGTGVSGNVFDPATAGTGTVTITYSYTNGCGTYTDNENITVSPAPSIAMASTDVSCNGGSDGTATATASGGSSPYSYAWSGGAGSSASVTNLSAGTYTVTVTDNNGCESTNSVTINEPTQLIVITSGTSVTCNGGSTGAVSAIATGGTSGYSYLWSNGATSSIVSGLPAGTYTVTATDANGCTDAEEATITEPSALVASIGTPTNVSCNGGSNGSATASGSGGTSPYTYAWSGGAGSSATATGLSAGTYTVTVTDANSCTDTETVTITEPTTVVASISTPTNVSCNGGNDGSATASGSGGTSPYTYAWSGGAGSSATATGLSAGTYTVTVTDANGCTDTETVTVTQPATSVSVSIGTPTNVSCNGGSDGSATATGTGGTGTISYAWSGGAGSSATATGLSAGTYTVTATDANGCTATANVTITEPAAVVASIGSSTNVSCNGGNNGSATASGSNGVSPYTYNWSGGAGSSATATGLSAGTYTVTVTDANGCDATQSVTITEPTVLVASIGTPVNVSCNGGSDGSATASASGGTSPYTYAWSGGAGSTASTTGLSAGTYTVTVSDANGCTDTETVTITEPTPTSATITSSSNLSCFSSNDGSATAAGSGGTTPYAYAWSSGAITATATGLAAGTFTVTVTDANGCTQIDSVAITQPLAIATSVSLDNNVSCNGGNDGGASVSVSGGTAPYSYAWSSSESSASATALDAGTAYVTITDANGCSAMDSILITEPTLLIASISSSTNVSCNAGSDGTATASASGGTAPYSYAWSGGAGSASNATSLSAGMYTVTITDANGCIADASVSITEPSALNVSTTATNVSCNGANDGSITAAASGGTAGYSFLWSTAATSASISSLSPGNYTVTVTDANGCTETATQSIVQPAALAVSATLVANVSCTGSNDGSANASASGGTTPYTYTWSGGAGSSALATGLSVGTFTVTATDANGCTATASVTVGQLDTVNPIAFTYNNIFAFLDASGTASISSAEVDSASSDNCSITSLSLNDSIFDCTDVGSPVSVILTAMDGAGNIDTAHTWVNVIDTVAPTALAHDTTIYLNAMGTATITPSMLDDGSFDSCGIASMQLDTSAFDCVNAGDSVVVVLTVIDVNGNVGTATSTVWIIDTVSPNMVTQNINIQLDSAGLATISPEMINAGSGDSCGIDSMWLSQESFDCADTTSPNLVVLYAMDVNGNVDSSTAFVSVSDVLAPGVIPVVYLTATLDASGNASITANDVDSASVDNCGIDTLYLSQYTFDCSAIGIPTTVWLYAVDFSGNIDSAQSMIEIIDTLNPTVVTQNFTAYLDASGQVTVLADSVDAGSSDNCAIDSMFLGQATFDCSDVGVNTTNLFVSDVSGNIGMNSVSITVLDTIAPQLTALGNDTIYLDSSGEATYAYFEAIGVLFDSCGIDSIWLSDTLFTCSDTGQNSVTIFAQDVSGNVSQDQFMLTVFDTLSPAIYTISDTTLYLGASGTVSITATQLDSASMDNCSISSISIDQSLFDCSHLGANTVSFTAIDVNGNSSSSTLIVTVVDSMTVISVNIDSTILCAGDSSGAATASATGFSSGYTYLWSDGQTTATATGLGPDTYYVTATSSGGCEIVDSVTFVDPAGMQGTLSAQDISCFNGNDGWVSASVTGGTSGYGFVWSNAATTDSIGGLLTGTYSVTITDANGCTIEMDTSLVSPTQILTSISASDSAVCTGDSSATLIVEISGGVGGYASLWDIGGNAVAGDTVENVGPGTYYLAVTDSIGCIVFDSVSIEENPIPVVTLSLAQDTVCAGTEVPLDNVSPLGGSYTGMGIVGDTLYTDSLIGTQVILYTYTDSNGCTSEATDSVHVLPIAEISFLSNPLELCAGEQIALNFAFPMGGMYTSQFADGDMLVAPDTAFNGFGGWYHFENSCGVDSDTFSLVVYPLPEVDLGSDTTLCNAGTMTLSAGAHSSYLWSSGASTSSIQLNNGEEPLTEDQTVWVVVESAEGCLGSDTIHIDVIDQPIFYLGDNIDACLSEEITLSVPNVYDNFLWSDSSSGLSIQAHDGTVKQPGTYQFWALGYNDGGCSYSDTLYLQLIDCDGVYVGISELDDEGLGFEFYPNPASTEVNLVFDASIDDLVSIGIYDAAGSLVKSFDDDAWKERSNEHALRIQLGEVANGIYLLRVEDKGGVSTKRLVIGR